ncbi:MAG: SDR family NAD(P)-dependent oxidoreductase [Candidatus Acidiferrales bacterium]
MRRVQADKSGECILITGAGGYIGSALAKAIASANPRHLIVLDHSEQGIHELLEAFGDVEFRVHPVIGDIADSALLNELFEEHRPDMIYHAAAYKHVPLMERSPFAVVRNNAIGTSILAKTAVQYRVARIVMISTDKAVTPRSAMGAAKRVAELMLLRWTNGVTRMSAIRCGNVLGSTGSVLPLFHRQLSHNLRLTVSDPEASRYFFSLEETVALILAAGEHHESGSIFVPETGTPTKILELARHLLGELGRHDDADGSAIQFTGLRPGEKLTEEFTFEYERTESVGNNLRRVTSPFVLADDFDSTVEDLEDAVARRDLPRLLDVLRYQVPEYQPSELLLRAVAGSSV